MPDRPGAAARRVRMLAGAVLGAAAVGPSGRAFAQQPPTTQPSPGAPRAPHSYGLVAGVVRDTAGMPVGAAAVRIDELHREYRTHQDGRFAFPDVPVGRWTLTVRRIGYVGNSRPVAVAAGDSTAVAVALVPSPVQLSTVVTTGTVAPRVRQDVLGPTSVLAEAALDRRLDGTVAVLCRGSPARAPSAASSTSCARRCRRRAPSTATAGARSRPVR